MSNFEFGFAKEDITPKRGLPLAGYFNLRPNRGALDRLAIKAAVFRENGVYTAIVSYDLCLFYSSFCHDIDAMLAAENSPLAGNVLYCATHTHTGPYVVSFFGHPCDEEYVASVKAKTVAALRDASPPSLRQNFTPQKPSAPPSLSTAATS